MEYSKKKTLSSVSSKTNGDDIIKYCHPELNTVILSAVEGS